MTINPWKLLKATLRIASAVLRASGKGEIANVVNVAEGAVENVTGPNEPDGGT